MSSTQPCTEWVPGRFTTGEDFWDSYDPIVVIISNQPLENRGLLIAICERAQFIVCADGGANRLRDLGLNDDEELKCKPNMICGDLDSIRSDVLQYYEKMGVRICKDKDKYSTDLQKCFKFITESNEFKAVRNLSRHHSPDSPYHQVDVVIFGGLGGRADQAFSQLQHLYTVADKNTHSFNGGIYLIATESLMFLLEKGLNKISAPVKRHYFTENVGIIPIGQPSIITTRGLEWDVTRWPTEFGTQISTSNHIKSDVVQVACTERVLFTLEFDKSCEK